MSLRDQLQNTLGSAYQLERELGGGGMSRVFVAEFSERKFDSATAIRARLFQERPSPATRANAAFGLAAIARTQGRLREASRWAAEATTVNVERGLPQAKLNEAVARATTMALFLDQPARAATVLESALAATPIESVPVAVRPYDDLAVAYAHAGRADRARELLASFDRARRDVVRYIDDRARHRMVGAIALAEKRYEDAAREFQASDQGECLACALPLLAHSLDLAGKPDSALAVYERYLTVNDAFRPSADHFYLAGAHKRAGELYDARGDSQKALSHYLSFLQLWKDADPELQPKVAEVRARAARLRNIERR